MKKGTKKTTPPKDETKPAKTRKKARPDCPPPSDPVAAPPESSRPQPSASGQPETSAPATSAPPASRSWTALCKAVTASEGIPEGAVLNQTTVLNGDLLRPVNGKVSGRVHGTREQDIQLDLVEIALDLEDELGVSVPDSMLELWLGKTLGAICQELERMV